MRALDAAFLLYEAFKEQQLPPDISTKILHDILFLSAGNGLFSMKKVPRSQKFSHWKTTGTEQADAYLPSVIPDFAA